MRIHRPIYLFKYIFKARLQSYLTQGSYSVIPLWNLPVVLLKVSNITRISFFNLILDNAKILSSLSKYDVITSSVISMMSWVKNWLVKQDFNIFWGFENLYLMHTKRVILARITSRWGSFCPFSQEIQRKQQYGKEGQRTRITFGCQQVNSLIFPDIIRQAAATGKTKI